jgi:psp operon transcriptional activator
MRQVEKSLLQKALRKYGQNQRRTADALGLRYDQLRGLVRKHGLSVRKRRSS